MATIRRHLTMLPMMLALLALACGGDPTSGAAGGDSTAERASGRGTSDGRSAPMPPRIGSDAPDATATHDADCGAADATASSTALTPGSEPEGEELPWTPCDQPEDCASGICWLADPRADLSICLDLCFTDEDCAAPARCLRLNTGGPDVVFVCLDPDFCLDRDGDGYGFGPGCLGPDCDDDDPEVYPGAPERCNGRDNSCSGAIDDNPVRGEVNGVDVRIGEDCDTTLPGICSAGRWTCVLGETLCVQREEPQATELCDPIDRTCDGAVDRQLDGSPIVRACYTGDPATLGEGPCRAGEQVCQDGAWPERCPGEILPREERCNGVDDDCDGVVDNVDPSLLQNDPANCGACGVQCADHLACRSGICSCAGGLSDCADACVDTEVDPRHCGACGEVCGSGHVCEEGRCVRVGCTPGTTRACENACGTGEQTCTEEGWGTCSAPALDSTRDCGNACGSGQQRCTAQGWTDCTAPETGAEEACTTPCGSGTRSCTAEGWTPCTAPAEGAERTCDNACGSGVQLCGPDGWGTCSAPALDSTRDCGNACGSGQQRCTPEGWTDCTAPETGAEEACTTPCGSGTRSCTAEGWTLCTAPAEGAERTCDNACGSGVQLCGPDGWGTCSAPALDSTRDCGNACGSGQQRCTAQGWTDCTAPVFGSLEPCTSPCGAGHRTCGVTGWSACTAPMAGDTQACFSTCGEGVETCTESGWRNCSAPLLNATRSCTTICESGTETCTPDGWSSCTARVPVPERCNLFDDSCDGSLDTGLSCRQPVHRMLRPASSNWAYTEVLGEALSGFVTHAENVFYLYSSDAEGRAVPFFRCFNPEVGGTGRHFLTTDPACERWQPEHLERAIGFIALQPFAGTMPLYRSWDPSVSTHFYTIDPAEHQARIDQVGASDEGVVGFVWPVP